MHRTTICLILITLTIGLSRPASADTITATTSDGVTIYGETWFADLGDAAPLVLLFHQGSGNARGEYPDIAAWLNDNGYRAIAWDFRSGGELFDSTNRTVAALDPEVSTDYCDGFPDFEAAIDYVVAHELAETVIVWGSSYSGALVFQLAAARPEEVGAVIVFSPASGGPMESCKAARWLDDVDEPIAVFTPEREMEYPHVIEQGELLEAAGARVRVVENGVHGSSMLVDTRTQHDMSELRDQVLDWLREVADGGMDQ